MKRHHKHAANPTDGLRYVVKCVAMLLFLGTLATTLSVVSVNTDSYVNHTTEASQKIESLSQAKKQLPRLKSVSQTASLTPAATVKENAITATLGTNNQTAHSTLAATNNGQGLVLSNGNTAGPIGTEAAARMAAATGVPQATWEYIIARESNGDPTVVNPSGAAGLFQTIPGWGSTATVEDQIQTAIRVYNTQGLAAWELP